MRKTKKRSELSEEQLEKARERDKKYNNKRKPLTEEQKEKAAKRQKEWAKNNKDKVAINDKRWYEQNKEKVAAYGKKYKAEHREQNKERKSKYQKEYRIKNIDTLTAYDKEYFKIRKQKPEYKEMRKKNIKKYLLKLSKNLNLSSRNLRTKLHAWSVAVRENQNNICQECGYNENLQAHHILPKHLFSNQIFEIWNGKTLCVDCYINTHSLLIRLTKIYNSTLKEQKL